jgi:hypothetical protein
MIPGALQDSERLYALGLPIARMSSIPPSNSFSIGLCTTKKSTANLSPIHELGIVLESQLLSAIQPPETSITGTLAFPVLAAVGIYSRHLLPGKTGRVGYWLEGGRFGGIKE